MISMEEVNNILDELAEEIPNEFYHKLNGGIILLDEAKQSPHALNNDLYILGQYTNCHQMGRYISIYYGSFEKLYGYLEANELREKLREVLLHEFTHHVESLAGEKDLEIEDQKQLDEYTAKHRYRYRYKNKEEKENEPK